MSEELNQEVNQEVEPQVPEGEQQEVQTPDYESQARLMGWKPLEEYGGDTTKWVDAKEFVGRAPLFEKLDKQGAEIREMKKAMKQLVDQQQTVREQAYKEAIATLKAQKASAVANGDSDQFLKIEQQEEALKQNWQAEKGNTQAIKQNTSPVFAQFLLQNPWYSENQSMRQFADEVGIKFAQSLGVNPGEATPEQEAQVLSYVVKKVKEKAESMQKPKAKAPAAVESGAGRVPAGSQGASKGLRESDLTPQERRAMENFVRWGVFKSKEDYLKSLSDK